MPETSSHARAVWAALLVSLLWSSSWVLIRLGLDDEGLPPITFAGLRYTIASLALVAVAGRRRANRSEVRSLSAVSWRPLLVLGAVYYGVTQGAQFVAIDSQAAATSSLLLAPTPFLVAVSSQFAIGETVRRRQLVGAALMAVGAYVFFAGDLGATPTGIAASAIGLAANVTGSLLGRAVNRRQHLSPLTVTATTMPIGASLLLGAGLLTEGAPKLGWTAIAVVVWLAVVNTALAFTLWNLALRSLTAVESASINNTMLIQIALLAWLFLGESPGVAGAAGIVIVSLGALLAQGLSFGGLRASHRPPGK